jgi:hypothetical protein
MAVATAMAASMAACSGSDPASNGIHGGSASGGSTPETQFYEQLQGVVCAAQAQCCQAAGYPASGCYALGNVDSRDYLFTGDPVQGGLGEAFVASAAAPCLTSIRQTLTTSAYCVAGRLPRVTWFSLVAMCPGLYAGGSYENTPLGGACSLDGNLTFMNDYQCVPSSDGRSECATWTTMTSNGATRWSGCVDAVDVGQLGDVCGATSSADLPAAPTTLRIASRCRPGLYCGPSSTCVAQGTEGESCAGGGSCSDGLTCDPILSLCWALPAVGDACTEYGALCQAGAACDARNVCAPLLAQGAACGTQTVPCATGLACAANSTCQPPPAVVGLGATCDGVTTTCSSTTYCDATAGVCVAQRAGGAECLGGGQCVSGQCVQGSCTMGPSPAVPPECGSSS